MSDARIVVPMTISALAVPEGELARLARELPVDGYVYEPKWDGFRCIAFRDGGEVDLRSRNDRPLARYFPELCEALAALPEPSFVLDGAQVEIDTWPRIPPYVEIEAGSKDEVVRVAALLGYAEEELTGENTIKVYALYGIDLNAIPELRF